MLEEECKSVEEEEEVLAPIGILIALNPLGGICSLQMAPRELSLRSRGKLEAVFLSLSPLSMCTV